MLPIWQKAEGGTHTKDEYWNARWIGFWQIACPNYLKARSHLHLSRQSQRPDHRYGA